VLVAAMVTRLLSGLLFGVTPLDLPTFGMAAGLFIAVAVLAGCVPAWRASRIDPVAALRAE
jgi:ABC-type antimicrobial peptide transport system permease subunit